MPRAALAGLVLASIVVRIVLGREITTPFVLIDELVHAELAESVLEDGRFRVRGEPITITYLYPLLLAPAWLASSMETTYELAKAIGAVVMSLAALPVFFWGRRLVGERGALVAAALTLAMPSLVFTGTLMTEVAFLPVFLLACWAIAHALESPMPARQALALAAVGAGALTRVQGLLLLAILVTAVVAYGRDVRRWWPTAAVLAAAAVALAVVPSGLGVWSFADDPEYGAGSLLRWLVYDLGALALAVGVIPLAALVALRPRDARERAFVAVAASATAWLLVLAAVGSHWDPVGVKERYMLHAMPLLFLALMLWLAHGAPRRWWALAAAAAVAALPLGDLFDDPSLLGNAFGLIPFDRLSLELDFVRALVVLLALAAAAVAVYRPRLVPALVFLYLLAANAPVVAVLRNHALGLRELASPSQWIDPLADGEVAYLNTSNYAPETLRGDLWSQWAPVWEAQFWNRDLGRVISLEYEEPAPLAQVEAKLDWETGTIEGGGAPAYVLADRRFELQGTPMRFRGRLQLWKTDGVPLRLNAMREGLHPDGSMERLSAYTRWRGSDPVRLTVRLTVAGEGHVLVAAGPLAVIAGAIGAIETPTYTREVVLSASPWRVTPRLRPPFRIEVHAERPATVNFR